MIWVQKIWKVNSMIQFKLRSSNGRFGGFYTFDMIKEIRKRIPVFGVPENVVSVEDIECYNDLLQIPEIKKKAVSYKLLGSKEVSVKLLYDKDYPDELCAFSLIQYAKNPAKGVCKIPDFITCIPDDAFLNMPNRDSIETIEFPDSLDTLYCDFGSVFPNLRRVELPSGIWYLTPSFTFKNCKYLEYVKLPVDIQSLDERCFYNCSSLKELELPDSISYLSECCVANCTALEVLKLPRNLISIDAKNFIGLPSLRCIKATEQVKDLVLNYMYFNTSDDSRSAQDLKRWLRGVSWEIFK